MNNIEGLLDFNNDKIAVATVHKTKRCKVMAIGLLRGQKLAKHKAQIPTLLTVLQGDIEFKTTDRSHSLKLFDTFEIPVNIEHEVRGMNEKNIFTLTQELN